MFRPILEKAWCIMSLSWNQALMEGISATAETIFTSRAASLRIMMPDGIWDEGEPGLEGWEIVLSGAENKTIITDSNGSYNFTGLRPKGDVDENLKANYLQTHPRWVPLRSRYL